MKIISYLNRNPKMKYLLVIGVVMFMLVTSIAKTFISKADEPAKVGGRANYAEVLDVPGVSFEISQELSNYATAVLEISKNIDFVKNASYSYKNGTDTFMMFNMTQYVIIVQKGTTFDFANKGTKSIESNSLNGIWFSNAKPYEKSNGKITYDVEAEVVITNTIYNDFYGLLTTITKDDEEWAMFVGSVNKEDSSMLSMIEYTTATFIADESNLGENIAVYEMDITDEPTLAIADIEVADNEVHEEEDPLIDNPVIEESKVEEPKQEETSAIEESSSIEPTVEVVEIPAVEETIPETVIETQSVEETIEEDIEESSSSEEETVNEIKEEPKKTVLANNQIRPVYQDSKAYTSNVYSMLNIGQTGYMTVSNQNTGKFDEIFIRLDSINTEEQTVELIKEYINSGESYYKSIEAPLGTHWESVSYSIKHDESQVYYTNISFVGLDGTSLKHRGIDYKTRTYDINYRTTKNDGWTTGYVTFYAVPNGCSSYALACGDSVKEFGYMAYYKVENK